MTEGAILDLKRQALQAKKSGDIAEARRLLEKAKQIAAASAQTSADFKRLAVERKHQGDIDGAREALAQAKHLEAQEQQQRQDEGAKVVPHPSSNTKLLRSIENGVRSGACSEEAPESGFEIKLTEGDASQKQTAEASSPNDVESLLKKEITLSKAQMSLYRYYSAFVDESTGREQVDFWKRYHNALEATLQSAHSGNDIPDLTSRVSDHGALKVNATDLSFVGETCDISDHRIKVSLLDAVQLLENKHMKRLLENPKQKKIMEQHPGSIRAIVTVQLPPNPEHPDDFVEETFEVGSSSDGLCEFNDATVCVDGARGSSRFAKLLARRLQRRRVTLDVYYVPEKKKLLSRSSNKTLLGSAVLELKDLLTSNFIAGEFPLLDVTGRHECGGRVRVAIRTGTPFLAEGDSKPKKEATTGLSQSGPSVEPYATLPVLPDCLESSSLPEELNQSSRSS